MANLAPVWLAERRGVRRIATLDSSYFNVYRAQGRMRFNLKLLG